MYHALFTPITIGNLTIRNRLAVPAMLTQYCGEDGKATERYIAYLEARAKGGWGLIITENHAVMPHAGAVRAVPGLWDDSQIAGHAELAARIHAQGTAVCCQIYHAGRQTHPKVAEGQTVAPSVIRDRTRRDLPRELSETEIAGIVKAFGEAAVRARKAGFDMVEIHGAHGYLINEFLSPAANKRKDRYGGTLFNRTRFLREILQEVRERVGPDYPVQLRLSAQEDVPGGISLSETMAVAQMAESLGVNSLHISQGSQASMHQMISPSAVPMGAWMDNAYRIRQTVSIPVICVGRVTEPMLAQASVIWFLWDGHPWPTRSFRKSKAGPGRGDPVLFRLCPGMYRKEQQRADSLLFQSGSGSGVSKRLPEGREEKKNLGSRRRHCRM